MNARRILVEPRRNLVFGFLDSDSVGMIDPLAGLVIAKTARAARQFGVVDGLMDGRAGFSELRGFDMCREFRHLFSGRGCGFVALPHHHPACVIEDWLARIIEAARAHIYDAGFSVRIFPQADDFGNSGQRGTGENRFEKPAVGIAEIGDRIERDIRDGLAKYDMKDKKIVDRRARIADLLREDIRRLHRKAWPKKPVIERDVAGGDCARRGMTDLLSETEVFEEIAWAVIRGGCGVHKLSPRASIPIPSWLPIHSHKTVSRTPACDNGKLMRMCLDHVVAEKVQMQLSGGFSL